MEKYNTEDVLRKAQDLFRVSRKLTEAKYPYRFGHWLVNRRNFMFIHITHELFPEFDFHFHPDQPEMVEHNLEMKSRSLEIEDPSERKDRRSEYFSKKAVHGYISLSLIGPDGFLAVGKCVLLDGPWNDRVNEFMNAFLDCDLENKIENTVKDEFDAHVKIFDGRRAHRIEQQERIWAVLSAKVQRQGYKREPTEIDQMYIIIGTIIILIGFISIIDWQLKTGI